MFGIMKTTDVDTLLTGLGHISQGVGEMMVVIGPLVGAAMAYLATWKTKAVEQKVALATVAAIPATVVVTQPAIAKATPDLPNVVSNATNVVESAAPSKN